jgi:hypothetical protein
VGSVIAKLTSSAPPLAFWSGYTASHLISARYLGHYCLPLGRSDGSEESQGSAHLVKPRRWVNLKGTTDENIWRSALRAVVGLLVLRPLMDQASILTWNLGGH